MNTSFKEAPHFTEMETRRTAGKKPTKLSVYGSACVQQRTNTSVIHLTESNPENQSFVHVGGLPVHRYQTAVRQSNGGPHHTLTYLLPSLPGARVLDTTPYVSCMYW
jgi:hypothetical protein